MDTAGIDPKTQQLLDLFDATRNDPAGRAELIRSPIDVLADAGLPVEPGHQVAVAQGLRSAAIAAAAMGSPSTGEERPLAKGIDFEQHFHVNVEWWGIVVRMDHEAVRELPQGLEAIGTLASAAAGAVKAAGAIGPGAAAVALGLAFWGAVFTAYVVVIPAIDQGKGVYLTITWPQIALYGASAGILGPALLPIPTAVV